MPTRKELVEALRLRYRSAAFSDRIKILDELVALTCFHRQHAIRVLRGRVDQQPKCAFAEVEVADAPARRCVDGLPNGCFAPVDKPPLAALTGPSACPEASPLDKPALALIDPPSGPSASPKT